MENKNSRKSDLIGTNPVVFINEMFMAIVTT